MYGKGTNILLLEMPFAQWDKGVVEDVKFLVQKRKLTLIIAHIERYYPFQKDKKYWEAVFDLPVYTQINTESFLSWRTRHRVLGFLKSGDYEVILGSDCHNMKTRLPNLQEGRNVIACKLGAQYLQEIDALGEKSLTIMEDKRVGKSNRSKAICITVIVLLCIGLTGLFLMEYGLAIQTGNKKARRTTQQSKRSSQLIGIPFRKSNLTIINTDYYIK